MKNKTEIGIGHVTRALQFAGFGIQEIYAMQQAMITGSFKSIDFGLDTFYHGEHDNLSL